MNLGKNTWDKWKIFKMSKKINKIIIENKRKVKKREIKEIKKEFFLFSWS